MVNVMDFFDAILATKMFICVGICRRRALNFKKMVFKLLQIQKYDFC